MRDEGWVRVAEQANKYIISKEQLDLQRVYL